MDMTTALGYSEDYADPQADVWAYSAACIASTRPGAARRSPGSDR
jgi:hypothetical protein